jgi:hypothetical protein
MREPSLWLNLLILAAFALITVRFTRISHQALAVSVATALTCIAYALLGSEMAPPIIPLRPLQWLAFALAVALPYLGSALLSYRLGKTTTRTVLQVIPSAVLGMLLLMAMPVIALALGCALTGVCP